MCGISLKLYNSGFNYITSVFLDKFYFLYQDRYLLCLLTFHFTLWSFILFLVPRKQKYETSQQTLPVKLSTGEGVRYLRGGTEGSTVSFYLLVKGFRYGVERRGPHYLSTNWWSKPRRSYVELDEERYTRGVAVLVFIGVYRVLYI